MKTAKLLLLTLAILTACFSVSAITTPSLTDELTGRQIGEGTRNLVICIHGWNPTGRNDKYVQEVEWDWLVFKMKQALPGNSSDPWALLLYHWEADANTGFADWSRVGYYWQATANAATAGKNAWEHGISLGARLPSSLRKVHIIAHSAGAWCAYQTASALLANPYTIVQVTLLDPYIPDEVPGIQGSYPTLSKATINGMVNWPSGFSTRFFLLENYFADDSVSGTIPNFPANIFPAGISFGTQTTFSWRARDINLQVDWSFSAFPYRTGLADLYYDWHSGPVLFYGDTIEAAIGGTIEPGLPLGGLPFDYNLNGWKQSLFYRFQSGLITRITAQPQRMTSVTSGASVTLTVSATSLLPFSFQWFKRGQDAPISGATFSYYNFTASSATAGDYVIRLLDSNGNMIFSDFATVTIADAPSPPSAAPTITSVSPSTLPTSFSTQLINIYGSNFKPVGDPNASTLIFRDPVNNPYVRTPIYVSASQLQYYITVQSAVGTWSVTVTNAGQAASNLKTFQVATPPPNTGSLTVDLSPAGAVSAGAQWRVDGGSYRNTGDTATGLTPGSHTVSFKSVSGYTTPVDKSSAITSGGSTTESGAYSVFAPSTYTLTINQAGAMGNIVNQPFGGGSGNTYDAGAGVQLTANANYGYHFVSWGGDAAGSANPTTIVMNGNKTVSANFASGDPRLGTLTVTIQPPAAVAAGVKWGWNENDFRDSGSSVLTDPGSFILTIHGVEGWIGPTVLFVTATAGQTSNYVVNFTQDTTPGLLTVTLSPPDAVTAGAHWRVNGGSAQGNGATVSLPPGTNYSVTFDSVPGWAPSPSRTVAVQRGQTTVVAGGYTPPVGQPFVGSISPAMGPISGGTVMTINGANFAAPAAVLVSGQAASNVLVASSTQITCVTPPGTNYGSASVIVQSSGGSATNLNSFAYGTSNGNKIDLLGSIGGSCFSVVVQGNHAYVGEGRQLLVLDVSSPSAPSKVGQVMLPGVVRGVAVFGNYAYVAAQEGGVQVVDISSPANPTVCGEYRASGYTHGIAIFGGLAYVANENLGLQILDLAKPRIPMLLSSTNVGAGEAVVVKGSANGVFAYVSTGGSLCVVDVSIPTSPRLRGQTAITGGSCYSVAILGNYVIAASLFGNLEIIDVSIPDSPSDVGHAPGISWPASVGVANNYVYAASSLSGGGFYVFSLSGASLTQIGHLASFSSDGYGMALTGSTAYVPARASGVKVVNISNPTGPSQVATFSDSGVFRSYNSVAVTQNSMAACGYPQGTVVGFNTVFDVSNPSAPSFAANPNAGGERVLARNGLAYVLTGGSNFIFNISTPTLPQVLKLFSNTAFPGRNMALAGNVLYIVGSSGANQPHLAAFNVSSPSAPGILGSKDFTEFSSGVATAIGVSGTKGLVGMQVNDTVSRFEVISLDLSILSSPVKRSAYTNFPSYPMSIEMSANGDVAFVIGAGNPSTLSVFDVSQPTALSLVTNILIDPAGGTGLTLSGNELIASTFQGVYVFDIGNPRSPVQTRSYQLSGARALSVSSELAHQIGNIYVADSDGGIVVLREQDIQSPSVYITNPTFSPVYTNVTSTLSLGGGSDDNLGVTAITWSNDRGGSGAVDAPFDSWYVSGIRLYPGSNILTLTAFDVAGNSGTDTLTVVYQTPKQNQTITFAALTDRTFGETPIPLAAAANSGLMVGFDVVSGPAAISNNVLTFTGAGSIAVRATQPGNDQFFAAPPVTNSFNVAKAGQTISFTLLSDKSVGDAPVAVAATASSGLLVTFSIVSGPATVSGNVVTLTGAGMVTVRASQSGNVNFNAAQAVERSFTVTKLAQFITFGALTRQVFGDAPFALAATASSGMPVSFSVLSGPAILSGNIVTLTGSGLVVLRASQSGDTTYAPARNADQSLVVAPGNNVITDFLRLPNGMFTFRFYGEPGTSYVVQGSTNLVNWLPLATNQVSGFGYLEFTDTAGTNHAHRFYRIAP